jgi:hypothetical protein
MDIGDVYRLDMGQVIHKLFLSTEQSCYHQHKCNPPYTHNNSDNLVDRKDKPLMSLRDYTPQQSHCPPPPYLGLMLQLLFADLLNPRNKPQVRENINTKLFLLASPLILKNQEYSITYCENGQTIG